MNNGLPRAVFALTSQGRDIYSAATRLAIASLRQSNPWLPVIVAVDGATHEALRASADPLCSEADDWLVVDVPQGNAEFRNRHVKTRLRALLPGPFLFLDSDILVRGDLSAIFGTDCDIAGACNHSRQIPSEQIWDQDRETLEAMAWLVRDDIYVNGGVLFFSDTDAAHALAAEWHRRWLSSAEATARNRDQPALNSALRACSARLHVLDDRYNAQIVPSPEVAVDAVVWHFYSSAGLSPMTRHEQLLRNLLAAGNLDKDEIRQMIECRHPWTETGVIAAGLQLAALRSEGNLLKRQLGRLREEHRTLQAALDKTLQSRSWRITAPLRALDRLVRGEKPAVDVETPPRKPD